MYQDCTHDQARAYKKYKFQEAYFSSLFEYFEQQVAQAREGFLALAKEGHSMRKLLRLKIKGTLCLFHQENQGIFFCTDCDFQSKEVVIGQFEPTDLRQIETLHQSMYTEKHTAQVKRQRDEWAGYKDEKYHLELHEGIYDYQAAMNDPNFKRKHKHLSNLQSFILAICGQNSELFLKGFDACIKNSLIVEDWLNSK